MLIRVDLETLYDKLGPIRKGLESFKAINQSRVEINIFWQLVDHTTFGS